MKYIGIKVNGIKAWLWFLKEHVKEENSTFECKEAGWCVDAFRGNTTIANFTVQVKHIEGRIESESLGVI